MTARPPMPNTAHPDLAEFASSLEATLSERVRGPIMRAIVEPIRWDDAPLGSPVRTEVLTVSTAGAPAPYTGERYVYTWEVLTDPHGRTIAGPARIEPWQKDLGTILMHGGNV